MAGALLKYNGQALQTPSGAYGINNLVPENIKSGVNIGGVVGTYAPPSAPDPILENNSWAQIKQAIDGGYAPMSWLNTSKQITSGVYSGYHLRLVDLSPNRYEKVGGGYTNAVFEFQELLPTIMHMNTTNTNAGGWADSNARTLINAILNDLEQDIQNIISECYVLSGVGSGTSSGTSSSANKLFLPAQYELFGTQTYSIGSSEGSPQYQAYAFNNTVFYRRKTLKGETTRRNWWTRSPNSGSSQSWVFVDNGGYANNNTATQNYYVAPCFAI